jgi:hypothetical protein
MRAIAIVLAMLGACAHGGQNPPAEQEPRTEASKSSQSMATFHLGGTWPWPLATYDLTVREDGAVEYEGKECVSVKGRRVVQLEPPQFAELRTGLAKVDASRNAACCTDVGAKVTMGGSSIQLCCPDADGRPLFALASRIEELTGAGRWIGDVNEQRGCGKEWRSAYEYHRGQVTFVQGAKQETWVLLRGSHFPLSPPRGFELHFRPHGNQHRDGELALNFTSGDGPEHSAGVAHVKITEGPAGNWTLLEYHGASCALESVRADDSRVEASGRCRDPESSAVITEFAVEAVK